MFPRSFFGSGFFPQRFFPKIGAVIPPIPPTPVTVIHMGYSFKKKPEPIQVDIQAVEDFLRHTREEEEIIILG